MKKGTSFFYILVSILCLVLCTCKLSLEDTELTDAPEASTANNQVSIIIPRLNNETKYINIFRKDASKSDIESIGMIFPNALMNRNYLFVDELVTRDHKYKYKVRYFDNNGYSESKWSNEISTKDKDFANPSTKKMTYTTSGVRFNYSKTDYTLTIEGTISKPDFDSYADEEDDDTDPLYKPMLIVSTSERSEAIPISSVADNTIIPLRNILPSYFQDTNISILGLVAQKNEYVDRSVDADKRVTTSVIWTELATISIRGNGNSSTFYIPSQVGEEGLDYTPPSN